MTAPAAERSARVARNTLFNLAGFGVPLLVAVLTMPAVVQGLGPERFGLLSLIWVVLGYASILDFGVSRALTKFLAETLEAKADTARVGALVWTSLWLQLVLGIITGLLFAAVAPVIITRLFGVPVEMLAETSSVFYIVCGTVPLLLVFNAMRGTLEAAYRFDLVNWIRAPLNSLNFVVPFVCVVTGRGLIPIVIGLAIVRLAGVLALAGSVLRLFPGLSGLIQFDRAEARRMFAYGGWVLTSSVASPLLMYIDRFVLGAARGIGAIGYYAAPYDIVTRLTFIPGSLVAALFPEFSAAAHRGDATYVTTIVTRTVKYLLIILGPVTVVLLTFPAEILHTWLGPDYAQQSAAALQLLALGIMVNSLAMVPITLLQGAGRPDLPAVFHLIELPLQCVLALLFVRYLGLTGAATAWLLRVVLDAVLLFSATSRVFRIGFSSYRRAGLVRPVAGYVLLAGAACASAWLLPLAPRAALIGTLLLAGMVVGVRLSLDLRERTALQSYLMPWRPRT